MVKELLLAILAFAVTALVIIILMTAVGNTLFPSAVSIVENRLERIQPAETAAPSPVSSPPEPPAPESAPAPPVPRPAPEPVPDAPPDEPAPSDAPEPIADVPPGDGGLTEEPETPTPDADETEPAASQPLSERLADELAPGEILPLSDGRAAYKVQSGDTFSQICKKVLGTGRQQVWQKAAEMMDIDYRTLRPGRVLIFDAAVLALGEEE